MEPRIAGAPKPPATIHNRADEFARLFASLGVGMRQRPFVNQPTAAGADRGDLQTVAVQQSLHFRDVERIGRGRKNLDGIKAERRRLFARIARPFQ